MVALIKKDSHRAGTRQLVVMDSLGELIWLAYRDGYFWMGLISTISSLMPARQPVPPPVSPYRCSSGDPLCLLAGVSDLCA